MSCRSYQQRARVLNPCPSSHPIWHPSKVLRQSGHVTHTQPVYSTACLIEQPSCFLPRSLAPLSIPMLRRLVSFHTRPSTDSVPCLKHDPPPLGPTMLSLECQVTVPTDYLLIPDFCLQGSPSHLLFLPLQTVTPSLLPPTMGGSLPLPPQRISTLCQTQDQQAEGLAG